VPVGTALPASLQSAIIYHVACVCVCVCVSSMMARGSLDTLVSISSVSTCVGAEAYPR
jgi:hypothetical protein